MKAVVTILITCYLFLCGLTLYAQVAPAATNAVPTAVMDDQRVAEFLKFEWLTKMSTLGLVFILVLVLGYLFRRLNNVSNRWLISLIPIGAAIYTLLARYTPAATWRDYLLSAVFGTIVSAIGVGMVFLAHDKLLVLVAKKWPAFSFLLADETVPDKCAPPPQPHDNGHV